MYSLPISSPQDGTSSPNHSSHSNRSPSQAVLIRAISNQQPQHRQQQQVGVGFPQPNGALPPRSSRSVSSAAVSTSTTTTPVTPQTTTTPLPARSTPHRRGGGGGGLFTVIRSCTSDGGGTGSPSPKTVVVIDATVALIGFVCLVIILLGMGTRVLSPPSQLSVDYGGDDGYGGGGTHRERSIRRSAVDEDGSSSSLAGAVAEGGPAAVIGSHQADGGSGDDDGAKKRRGRRSSQSMPLQLLLEASERDAAVRRSVEDESSPQQFAHRKGAGDTDGAANSNGNSNISSSSSSFSSSMQHKRRPKRKGGGGPIDYVVRPSRNVNAQLHALLDGMVGRDALIAAVEARARRKAVAASKRRAAIVDGLPLDPNGAKALLSSAAAKDGQQQQQQTRKWDGQHLIPTRVDVDVEGDGGGGGGGFGPVVGDGQYSVPQLPPAMLAIMNRKRKKEKEEPRRLFARSPRMDVNKGRSFHREDEVEEADSDVLGLHATAPEERAVFDDDASYFVSIAQFRDVLCPQTIAELYANARNPRRVFAGIVDQREKQTVDVAQVGRWVGDKPPSFKFNEFGIDFTCNPWYMMKECATSEFCPTDNIRVRHSWPNDSQGPTWGRYYAMLMYQGEKYFMMIDSHSRFVLHWDMQIITNLMMVPKTSKKVVMSHYPGTFETPEQLLNQRYEDSAMMMCFAKYLPFGIIRMVSEAFVYVGYPTLQPFSAGGFVVGDAQFVHEVPFDPHLFFVFDGEEILYSARLWTHGFDLYTPRNNILFHHYARHDAPRFWGNIDQTVLQRGQARVKHFMKTFKNHSRVPFVAESYVRENKIDIDEHIYGLGKERSIEEYYQFAGIDPVNWVVKYAFCHNITIFEKTPYKYHPRGWEVNKPDST